MERTERACRDRVVNCRMTPLMMERFRKLYPHRLLEFDGMGWTCVRWEEAWYAFCEGNLDQDRIDPHRNGAFAAGELIYLGSRALHQRTAEGRRQWEELLSRY